MEASKMAMTLKIRLLADSKPLNLSTLTNLDRRLLIRIRLRKIRKSTHLVKLTPRIPSTDS